MVREKKWVEYPDDRQLGRSRDTDGAKSPNLYVPGSRGVKGQAKIFDIDEDEADSLTNSPPVFVYVTNEYESDSQAREREERDEAIAKLISLAIDFAVANAPHAKRWWYEKALPAIKSMRNKIAKVRNADSQAATAEMAALSSTATANFSDEVDAVLEERGISMSSAEAKRHFLEMLVAAAIFEEKKRILSNVRIEEGGDGFLELKSAIQELTTQQVAEFINPMLEANPDLLDEETSVEFMKRFGGGRNVDGQYVPVSSKKVKEALRLTDGQN